MTLDSIQTISGAKTFSNTITGSITGNAGTATKIASISNDNIMTLDSIQTASGAKTFNAATTLNSTLAVAGNSELSGNVGVGTAANSNHSSILHLREITKLEYYSQALIIMLKLCFQG